jgi:hypothetical protein
MWVTSGVLWANPLPHTWCQLLLNVDLHVSNEVVVARKALAALFAFLLWIRDHWRHIGRAQASSDLEQLKSLLAWVRLRRVALDRLCACKRGITLGVRENRQPTTVAT